MFVRPANIAAGPTGRREVLTSAMLLAALAVAFAPVLAGMARVWESDPQYSHGYLVPLFAAALLWLRRGQLQVDRLRPSGWGLLVLGGALALRHAASYYYFDWFEQLALVACVPGVILTVGGREALRWAWPSAAFLLFMVPLPYTFEVALREPLRQIGTSASTYVLQTVGLPAVAEGNVIAVGEARIGVVEACSGLRMMTIFFALSTAVAMASRRPLWERCLVVASAAPIAVIANVARIASTAVLYGLHFDRFADLVFHDLAGWLMMPLALGLLWLEIKFLSGLIVEESVEPHATPLATADFAVRRPDRQTTVAGSA